MRKKVSNIILAVSLILIWFFGGIGGNVVHTFTSHFCFDTFTFTLGHHSESNCEATSCCSHEHASYTADRAIHDDCSTCMTAPGKKDCFKDDSHEQVEQQKQEQFLIAYEQIKQLCLIIFDTETSYHAQRRVEPPLLCYSSRHILSMKSTLLI